MGRNLSLSMRTSTLWFSITRLTSHAWRRGVAINCKPMRRRGSYSFGVTFYTANSANRVDKEYENAFTLVRVPELVASDDALLLPSIHSVSFQVGTCAGGHSCQQCFHQQQLACIPTRLAHSKRPVASHRAQKTLCHFSTNKILLAPHPTFCTPSPPI